jgi:hypothetical protein
MLSYANQSRMRPIFDLSIPMQIPSFLYGQFKEVKSSCQRIVKRLATGKSWAESLGDFEFLDSEMYPGFLIIDGPSPITIGNNFHLFCLMREVSSACYRETTPDQFKPAAYRKHRITVDKLQPIFEESLQTVWGFSLLLCRQDYLFLGHNTEDYSLSEWEKLRYKPFLRASLTYWDQLVEVACRYSTGGAPAHSIWQINSLILFAIARMGISQEELSSDKCSPESIKILIEKALSMNLILPSSQHRGKMRS